MSTSRQAAGRPKRRKRGSSNAVMLRWGMLACFAVLVLFLVAFELGSMSHANQTKKKARPRPTIPRREKNKPKPTPKADAPKPIGQDAENFDYDVDLSAYKLAVEYMETLTGVSRDEGDLLGLSAGAFKVPPFSSCVRTAERILGSVAFCDFAWRSGLQMGRVDMVADTLLLAGDANNPNTLLVLQDPRQGILDSETLECNVCGLIQVADVAPFVAVALDRVLGLYRASPVSLRELDLPWVKSKLATLMAVEPELDVTKSRHTSSLSLTYEDYVRELACLSDNGPTCVTRLGNREWVMLAAFDYLMGNRYRSDKNGCYRMAGDACVREFDNLFWTMEDRSRLVLLNNLGSFGEVGDAYVWLDGLHRWPADFVALLEEWESGLGEAVVGHLEWFYPLAWSEFFCDTCELPAAELQAIIDARMSNLLTELRTRISAYAILVIEEWEY